MRRLAVSVIALAIVLAEAGAAAAQIVDNVSHHQALVHYRLGEDLMHGEQFAKAADEFQAAIKFDPLLTIAHYELGQAYMSLRRYVRGCQAGGESGVSGQPETEVGHSGDAEAILIAPAYRFALAAVGR
jgi:tetratricopeptide (TPR) repeat protein